LAEHAELFTSGKGGMDAIAAAVRGATHHVHVLFYIFAEDETGTALRDLLAAKAKEGVHVRILVDALGSSSLRRAFLQPLRDAGAEVVFFHPPRLSLRMPKINFRNHRKIVVCDGRIGFTGGLNVADEYVVGRPGEPPWRDTMVELVGPPVEWLQLHFLEDWQYATGTSPFGSLYFPAHLSTGKTLVQVVGSAPDMELRPLHGVYFAAINAARTRVYVSTPYFVPDEALLQALVVAALRGVDVRVLVPQRNDHTFVAAASRSYFDELLRAGVRIFEYRPTMHHAKTLVIDDELGIVGTANMDTRSMRLSFEVAALLFDETLTRELAIHFEEDARQADEVTAAQRSPISLGSRLLEGGTRLFSPLL
jgi:cardiolipin synthase